MTPTAATTTLPHGQHGLLRQGQDPRHQHEIHVSAKLLIPPITPVQQPFLGGANPSPPASSLNSRKTPIPSSSCRTARRSRSRARRSTACPAPAASPPSTARPSSDCLATATASARSEASRPQILPFQTPWSSSCLSGMMSVFFFCFFLPSSPPPPPFPKSNFDEKKKNYAITDLEPNRSTTPTCSGSTPATHPRRLAPPAATVVTALRTQVLPQTSSPRSPTRKLIGPRPPPFSFIIRTVNKDANNGAARSSGPTSASAPSVPPSRFKLSSSTGCRIHHHESPVYSWSSSSRRLIH